MSCKMSQLERNIDTIIDTFHRYSRQQGHEDALNKKEFKDLVKTELQNFLKKENKNDKIIDHIMEDLDTNADQQLSFEEFIMLMARLTWASHEKMHEDDEGPGHHHKPGLGEDAR
ncbi:protein S100-A9 [Piliocolobus tephrosceles]|uniref:Protein S100 n=1 Tax=Piliocolobus tephrosceles TaxID=591936 RepID=A0A8C9ITA1_9PRIM|nr:protein S100-A9 [Piliocolobus tephrosceles]